MMKTIITFFIILLIFLSCQNSNSPAIKNIEKIPGMVIHRGASRLAPENTLSSFLKAMELGSEYVEVDVRESKDGVLYNLHDFVVDRTTNGKGIFANLSSAEIDKLDAGSWFDYRFRGEKIPTIESLILAATGKCKIYFDVKYCDIDKLVTLVKKHNFEDDCFFWFGNKEKELEFNKNYPDLNQKVNCSDVLILDSIVELYHPEIIECDIHKITPELQLACKEKKVKLMANCLTDKWEGYKKAIKMGVDLVNIDHPDYFSQMVQNKNHQFTSYRYIAHRGGIVEDIYDEFDPRSIKAAIDSGYWMLEIDVRPTADKHLIVYHDDTLERIYGDSRRPEEMTLTELKKLKALKGGYSPLTFEEVAEICKSSTRIMVDVKPLKPEKWFISEIENILVKNDLANSAYYIRNDFESMCKYGRFGFRMSELDSFKGRVANGEDIVSRFYLFDHGNRLNAETVNWCQSKGIDVCASVNAEHYKLENNETGAKRDIEHLARCGVTAFQIDSQYSVYLQGDF